MSRLVSSSSLWIILLMLLAACRPTEALSERLRGLREAGEVRAGTALTAPFVSRNAEGDLIGFDVDLIQAIMGRLGVRVAWQEMAFADLLPQLQGGDLDMVIAAMYISEEREEIVDFSQGYLETGLALTVRSGDERRFANLSDNLSLLEGLRLGVKERSTGQRYAERLQQAAIRADVRVYLETRDSLDDLRSGQLDGVLNDYLNSLYDSRQHGGTSVILPPLERAALGIALRAGDDDLRLYVNQAIDALRADGTIDRLFNQWIAPQTP